MLFAITDSFGLKKKNSMKTHRAHMKNQIRTAMISVSFLTIASCTSYTAIHGIETAPGNNVRVRLSDKGAVDLVQSIGPRARQLEGTLKQVTDSSMVVSVRRVTREGGGEDTYDGQDISIPSQDIETAEASRTSVSRSILAAGGILASALLVARGAGDISGGSSNRPPTGGR
ncbi:MAG TPA: hypothetical protein VF962_10920 [Gemmatimonadaceae bacterium]